MYESKVKYYYGTGRRKNSVARVRLYPGTGAITINGRSIDEYFGLETLKLIVRQPLALTEIRIVVDEPHDWVQILHALSPSHSFRAASGKLSTTTTPPASRRANFMDAPCPSAMPLQIPRPIPSP